MRDSWRLHGGKTLGKLIIYYLWYHDIFTKFVWHDLIILLHCIQMLIQIFKTVADICLAVVQSKGRVDVIIIEEIFVEYEFLWCIIALIFLLIMVGNFIIMLGQLFEAGEFLPTVNASDLDLTFHFGLRLLVLAQHCLYILNVETFVREIFGDLVQLRIEYE